MSYLQYLKEKISNLWQEWKDEIVLSVFMVTVVACLELAMLVSPYFLLVHIAILFYGFYMLLKDEVEAFRKWKQKKEQNKP
jgi:hypothetical protein